MAERALTEAEAVVLEAVRKGDYEAAARILFREAFRPLYELVAENAKRIAELTESVKKLLGEVARLRGRDVEYRVGLMLKDWFRRHAPDYEVFMWSGAGGDVLIEGRGVLAAIDIAITPKLEDVRQLKDGIGAVKSAWGRKPDILIIYSQSGLIPVEVAEQAHKMGVRVVRGPMEVKKLMDELAERAASSSPEPL